MDVLILLTVGRRSGQPRETPVTWFADGEDAWLVVAQGGGSRDPDWYLNLMGHPNLASIELPGSDAAPVAPRVLDGAERDRAWQGITAAHPRSTRTRPTGYTRWSGSRRGAVGRDRIVTSHTQPSVLHRPASQRHGTRPADVANESAPGS